MLENLNSPWVFGSIVSISLAISFIVWRAGTIVIEKLGITIGSKNKVKSSHHSKCAHSRDIMEIIHRTAEHYEKIQAMKKSIMKEQMRYYEEIEEEVLGFFKKIFIKLLIEKTPDEMQFINNNDYKNYILIIKVVAADLKSYIRNCFSMNHYITYTIESQNDYVDKKKNVLSQKITEMLNDYWRGEKISRSEIYKANKEHVKLFEDQVEDIFNRAFLIARETYERIEREEKIYQKYIEDMVGNND